MSFRTITAVRGTVSEQDIEGRTRFRATEEEATPGADVGWRNDRRAAAGV